MKMCYKQAKKFLNTLMINLHIKTTTVSVNLDCKLNVRFQFSKLDYNNNRMKNKTLLLLFYPFE